jgi:hypothetical protein
VYHAGGDVMRRKFRIPEYFDFDCFSAKEQDLDHIRVEFDYQPPEPDVNVGESVEICCVWYEDEGNIIDWLVDEDIRELEDMVLEKLCTNAADYYEQYADYAYEQRLDREYRNES